MFAAIKVMCILLGIAEVSANTKQNEDEYEVVDELSREKNKYLGT